jgi:hypothetical protein
MHRDEHLPLTSEQVFKNKDLVQSIFSPKTGPLSCWGCATPS